MNSGFIHVICVLLIAMFAASCSKHEPSKPAEKTLYTCSMHPQVVEDNPQDCPICGMKLVEVKGEAKAAAGLRVDEVALLHVLRCLRQKEPVSTAVAS